MKHVFQIHNSLLLKGALKYIDFKGIAQEECIFLCWRGMTESCKQTGIASFDYPFAIDNIDFRYYLDFARGNKELVEERKTTIAQFKDWFASCVQGAFIYYPPHLFYFRDRVIIQLPNCKGFYFLEEGLGSYTIHQELGKWKDQQSWWTVRKNKWKSKQVFGFDIQCEKGLFFPFDKYQGAIGYTPSSFEGLPNRINIGYPSEATSIPLESRHILVLDNYSSEAHLNKEGYFDILRLFFEKFASKDAPKLYYKVHPTIANDPKKREELEALLEECTASSPFTPLPFPEGVVLEELLSDTSQDVVFYGFFSSVLHYAVELGFETHFLSKPLFETDHQFRSFMRDNFPESFLENMEHKDFFSH